MILLMTKKPQPTNLCPTLFLLFIVVFPSLVPGDTLNTISERGSK